MGLGFSTISEFPISTVKLVNLWLVVNDTQTSNFLPVNDGQAPGWSNVVDTQSSGFANISGAQGSLWAPVVDNQTSNFENI